MSLTVKPEDTQTHYDLGIAYKEMGLYDEALVNYRKALWQFQDQYEKAQVYLALGYTYEALKQSEPARDSFRRYLAIVPSGRYADDVKQRIGSMPGVR